MFIAYISGRYILESFVKPVKKGILVPGRKSGFVSLMIITLAHAVSSVVVCFFLYPSGQINLCLFVSGLAMCITGFAGRIYALKNIGRSYSMYIRPVKKGALVTGGIYSIVRHPLYLFYILEMTGFTLITPRLLSALALLAVILAILFRIEREDKALASVYKVEFFRYKKSVKSIIPYII